MLSFKKLCFAALMIFTLASLSLAQNPVVFQVNMNFQIAQGNFNPTAGDIVVVRGSFNGWGGVANQCTITGSDTVYKCTVDLDNSYVGQTIEYKFVIIPNGGSDNWESVANRTYGVTAGGGTIPAVYFNDQGWAVMADVEVLFRVNMQVQLLNGNFDPNAGDIVVVRGSFNGWGGTSAQLTMETGSDIYSAWIQMENMAVGSNVEYKFVIVPGGGGNDNWESNDNRVITITGEEPDLLPPPTGNGFGEITPAVVYFSNVGPDQILTMDVMVNFRVNMRPAYYKLEEVGYIVGSVSTDTIWAIDEVACAGFFNAWPWGSFAPEHMAHDDGIAPDAVAGDSIFTAGIQFFAGDPKELIYKYGINGFDNEAGFAMNHSRIILDNNPVFTFGPADIFGSQDTLYTQWTGVKQIPQVNAPSTFTVHQNYPNPFNPTTSISFDLPMTSEASIAVFDITGREVYNHRTETLSPGAYTVEFNAANLSSGVYFYKVTAGNYSEVRKMTLLK